ncbi:MAG: CPBP family glutamic-type intramembrane protease [Actinomycetaceae bacterium]|nr:CPBP family glutamic-type intramembrane protease [Actinomycetaceae bacterium]MDU0969834.1 CPBP family glutamic-type intramembrane protease [Actinomycetaceae bacterium]
MRLTWRPSLEGGFGIVTMVVWLLATSLLASTPTSIDMGRFITAVHLGNVPAIPGIGSLWQLSDTQLALAQGLVGVAAEALAGILALWATRRGRPGTAGFAALATACLAIRLASETTPVTVTATLVALPTTVFALSYTLRTRRVAPLVVGHALYTTYVVARSLDNSPAATAIIREGVAYALLLGGLAWGLTRAARAWHSPLPKPAADTTPPPRRIPNVVTWVGVAGAAYFCAIVVGHAVDVFASPTIHRSLWNALSPDEGTPAGIVFAVAIATCAIVGWIGLRPSNPSLSRQLCLATGLIPSFYAALAGVATTTALGVILYQMLPAALQGPHGTQSPTAVSGIDPTLAVIDILILAFLEEYLYAVLIALFAWKLHASPWLTIVVAVAVRCAVHLYYGTLTVPLSMIPVGLFAGWIVVRYRTAWPLAVAHLLYDACQALQTPDLRGGDGTVAVLIPVVLALIGATVLAVAGTASARAD